MGLQLLQARLPPQQQVVVVVNRLYLLSSPSGLLQKCLSAYDASSLESRPPTCRSVAGAPVQQAQQQQQPQQPYQQHSTDWRHQQQQHSMGPWHQRLPAQQVV